MATAKLMADPPADDSFLTKSITLRGTTYTFRELKTKKYDELVRMATDKEDMIDRTVLLRLMAVESAVEPTLTPEGIAEMPYPVSRRILNLVNNMHYFDAEEAGEEGESPND